MLSHFSEINFEEIITITIMNMTRTKYKDSRLLKTEGFSALLTSALANSRDNVAVKPASKIAKIPAKTNVKLIIE